MVFFCKKSFRFSVVGSGFGILTVSYDCLPLPFWICVFLVCAFLEEVTSHFSSWKMNVFPHLICSFLEVVETVKVLCDNVLGC